MEDTIAILRGLRERYEAHHKVRITDGALVAAASLSHRYITNRRLPDKAIDLIDEAASRLRMEIDSSPEEIDALRRQVDRLKMEQFAIKKETDAASKARLARLEQELADAEEKLRLLESRWAQEKAALNRIGELKTQIDQLRIEQKRPSVSATWLQQPRLPTGGFRRWNANWSRPSRQRTKRRPVAWSPTK